MTDTVDVPAEAIPSLETEGVLVGEPEMVTTAIIPEAHGMYR